MPQDGQVTVEYKDTTIATLDRNSTRVVLKTEAKRCSSDIEIAYVPLRYTRLTVINGLAKSATITSPCLADVDGNYWLVHMDDAVFAAGTSTTVGIIPNTTDNSFAFSITEITSDAEFDVSGDFTFNSTSGHYEYIADECPVQLTVELVPER